MNHVAEWDIFNRQLRDIYSRRLQLCARVVLNPPPASPWRPDTIDLGGLILRRVLPYDTAEAHIRAEAEVGHERPLASTSRPRAGTPADL